MLSIAVDIGGTFTDVVAADPRTGRYAARKVPTTPGRLVEAVGLGALAALDALGRSPGEVERFVHGTTVGTNAALERRGAVTAVLATDGFEDVLEIGRQRRSVLYDLFMDAETPVFLAPRQRRRGIRERIGAEGDVVLALDEEHARAAVRTLVADHGVEAFAVCLLFSFRNPAHELRLREIIHEEAPGAGVSLSCEVDPEFREYERTVVTSFDAYLRPVIERYVRDLVTHLREVGITAPLQIMQSRGGITSAGQVAARPVSVLLSGPAAGVIGAREAGLASGASNLITIDVGGTSADIALVAEGKPLVSTSGRIGGYPLRVPMVDVNAIGAGGGSIAWIDAGGGFRVGPRSAGSDPGPACYGRGGTDPTVTDASLVLGYLDPDSFAIRLDGDAAHAAVARLGERLGLPPVKTAAGIHRILNAGMADGIRLVSIRRGHDPRDFALVPLGGAGPVHGGRLAAELSIPRMIVPPTPGVLSALGLLFASVEHDAVATVAVRAAAADPASLERVYAGLEAQTSARLAADGVELAAVETARSVDARYAGQTDTLPVPIDGLDPAEIAERFHDAHHRVNGHADRNLPVEIVNLRVVQSFRPPRPPLAQAAGAPSRPARSRPAYFEELGGFVDTPVVNRSDVVELTGPAIVEQADTTLVLYPGQHAVSDGTGNLIVSIP